MAMDQKLALERIQQFSRSPLTEEEVYLFDVILCDNDIDRDLECFSDAALQKMQALFVGKTGIFDHDPKTSGQTARIYDTELVQDGTKRTADGRAYLALKGHAYMVRTEGNADLIREIEGGIKKEVSVSCSAARKICSVCGADRRVTACQHVPGRTYGDKTCHLVLDEITDAYEWSFVAVPAQVRAGVTKQFQKEACGMEEQLQKQAALLASVEEMLRTEVLQLCARGGNAVSKALTTAAGKMELEELMQFKQALLVEQQGTAQVQLLGEADAKGLEGFCTAAGRR